MFLFAKMAGRNIVRNLRRTLITLAAITFGLASIILFFGFSDGFHAQWVENSVKIYGGHLQIMGKGYNDDRQLNKSIKDVDLINDMVSGLPAVTDFTTRIDIHGLASTAESSRGVVVRGIDLEPEKRITSLDQRIIEGEYLEKESSGGIMVGYRLAQRLNARIGDKIVLMVQAADGSLGAELYRLRGIFKIGAAELDTMLAIITLKDAQTLTALGNRVTQVVLTLDHPESVFPLQKQLTSKLGLRGYEVISWQDFLPLAKEMIDLSSVFMYVVLVIVLIVVSLGILNTMLMSIMERTREFGIMMALGTKPRQIIRLVMLESAMLGSIGVMLGIGVGIGLNRLISINGFDLSEWSGAMELVASLHPVIYPSTSAGNVVLAMATTFLTTLVVSIYPALKAARLNPVEAIHFV